MNPLHEIPHDCMARIEYLRVANLSFFNVLGSYLTRANGASRSYVFPDGSRFVVLYRGAHAYVGKDGRYYAIREARAVASK